MIAAADFTVFPANSQFNSMVMDNLANILSASSSNVGHLQLPMSTRQTTPAALVKHTRTIEDHMLRSGVSLEHKVALLFTKPNSNLQDRRAMLQNCIAATCQEFSGPAFEASAVLAENRIGPLPLIRVADMIGFDESNRPGASARVEQMLVLRYHDSPRVQYTFAVK